MAQKGIHSSEDLCNRLLKEAHVALLPGAAFGYNPNELVTRLAYVDFNGKNAFEASKKLGLSSPLDLSFLNEHCPKIVQGTQSLVNWLKP